jgi:hypothetical protein
LNFYQCAPCDAYVGCHKKNQKYQLDGTEPLGRLANSELRMWKSRTHRVFDPLWQKKDMFASRKGAYQWLADELHINIEKCHVGMFDIEMCKEAIEACKRLKAAIKQKRKA